MRKLLLPLLLLGFVTDMAFGQSYNGPESVEFDYANNRWLVANKNNGTILARSANGTLSTFASGFATSGPYGIEIVGDHLYACANGGTLFKFNLLTGGAPVASTNLGATFLNGITHDNSGNLFITDFTAKKIYRYNTNTGQFNVFVTNLAKSPNGILFDEAANRCVFVNWGSAAPIMAVNLSDSSTTTLANTSLSNCDGLARDGQGNWYVANWGLSGVSRFSSDFSTGPTTVVSGLNSPADIFYNTVTDTLAVPNSGASGNNANTVTFHYFGQVTGHNAPATSSMIDLWFNESNRSISISIDRDGPAQIRLMGADGREIAWAVEMPNQAGIAELKLPETLASGIYLAELSHTNRVATLRFVLSKH